MPSTNRNFGFTPYVPVAIWATISYKNHGCTRPKLRVKECLELSSVLTSVMESARAGLLVRTAVKSPGLIKFSYQINKTHAYQTSDLWKASGRYHEIALTTVLMEQNSTAWRGQHHLPERRTPRAGLGPAWRPCVAAGLDRPEPCLGTGLPNVNVPFRNIWETFTDNFNINWVIERTYSFVKKCKIKLNSVEKIYRILL